MSMNANPPAFREPTGIEKLFNRLMGFLVGLGIGPAHIHLLEVRGRKTGKLYVTPVDLLPLKGKEYLVAPRGLAQWVRNAQAAGEIVLKRGNKRQKFGLRPLDSSDKPEVLKAYLDSYKNEVQRFFPIPAGSPIAAFAEIAGSYPAFELVAR
jgi:deazaflavin-dependent oxidoreductase (nitroreductase family)